jgi:hypothetical protein
MDFAEIRNRYEVRKLSADEQVNSFNCGDADLNVSNMEQSEECAFSGLPISPGLAG